jgi:hypothetical protein
LQSQYPGQRDANGGAITLVDGGYLSLADAATNG